MKKVGDGTNVQEILHWLFKFEKRIWWDANHAFRVVEGENEESWRWYLERLFENLGIIDGMGLTIMSDQQKGLAKAIKELVPQAEYRNCARHIYANWKKMHRGEEYRKLFWKAAYTKNDAQWKMYSNAIMDIDSKAYDEFIKQDPTIFCRAFINTLPKCDVVTSNLVETFNSYICKMLGERSVEFVYGPAPASIIAVAQAVQKE
ncbi:hypothetical protein GH714_032407 [Hevea brasiliensis]|uniref:MULE transposase domain-containing protein n=1 Tax=Hevea brasiliensis TaxID=3981 RepID=A0A6A6L499_HEVBR|nr:hypothetical protein GH714_032407 [Hevea brasiliensis]